MPKKKAETSQDSYLQVVVDKNLLLAAKLTAKNEGKTLSGFVREVLFEKLTQAA